MRMGRGNGNAPLRFLGNVECGMIHAANVFNANLLLLSDYFALLINLQLQCRQCQ